MENTFCIACKNPKAPFSCGICAGSVCKRCAQAVTEGCFTFLTKIPENLTHRYYCGPCFNLTVGPAVDNYEATMDRARKICVFHKGQGEETRRMKRSEKPLRVAACPDRQETMMRLAFLAAHNGFNALLDVDIVAKKVRNEGYQTMSWEGVGIPTNLDVERIELFEKQNAPGAPRVPNPISPL